MSLKKKLSINSSSARGFLFFLLLTTIIAALIKLSKTYQTTYDLKIAVVGVPIEKTIKSVSVQNISIRARTTGFMLLSKAVQQEVIDLPFNSFNKEEIGSYTLSQSALSSGLSELFPESVEILSFKPEKLMLEVDSLSKKRVEVVSKVNLNYLSGYGPDGPFTIVPDSITIVGPKGILDTLDAISTVVKDLEDLSNTTETTVAIDTSGVGDDVRFSERDIVFTQKVSKFTEGKISVPITIINNGNVTLKVFPRTIDVFFTVALDDFDDINATDFLVTCDFRDAIEGEDKLIVNIAKRPDNLKSVRLSTKQVQYIVVN